MSKALVAAACLSLAAMFSGSAFAQDIFVKFSGMPGSSTLKDRTDWIEAASLSEGLRVTSTNSAMVRSGKTAFDRVTLTKALDAASVHLREAAAGGKVIPKVDIEVKQSGERGAVYYKLTLTNAVVQAAGMSASKGGGEFGQESIELAYDEIRWEYTPIDPVSGRALPKVSGGWNVAGNRKL